MKATTAGSDLDADFARFAAQDDDSASREILASGMFIHIAAEDTPEGFVVRVDSDGREVVVRFDRELAVQLLGG